MTELNPQPQPISSVLSKEGRPCPYCGDEISTGAKNCRNCGELVDEVAITVAQPLPQHLRPQPQVLEGQKTDPAGPSMTTPATPSIITKIRRLLGRR